MLNFMPLVYYAINDFDEVDRRAFQLQKVIYNIYLDNIQLLTIESLNMM